MKRIIVFLFMLIAMPIYALVIFVSPRTLAELLYKLVEYIDHEFNL